jgi:hypothetical protein
MADDDLSQREKRAARHKVESRKGAPAKLARKAVVPAIVILVLAGVATGFWWTATHTPDCPTHWHATFGVFVPSASNASQPEEVNFRSPFYDISGGQMPERAHMHQSDGYNQMHFEQAGTCVGVQEWMRYVGIKLTSDSITLEGHHADLGQTGTWKDSGAQTLHVWIESNVGGTWTWQEHSVKSILGYQLKDGEKILVYYGSFSDAQVQQMKASIHDPVSRQAGFVTPTGHPTASASATSST